MSFLGLRRAVMGFEHPGSSLATYTSRPLGDESEAQLEAAYRSAVRSIGSRRHISALQRCLIDLDSAAHRMAGAPLTLPWCSAFARHCSGWRSTSGAPTDDR